MERLSRALAACLVVAALLGPAATAWADGDPASDILAFSDSDVFSPYNPKAVSPPLVAELKALTREARRAHAPIKVAIVAQRSDLGAIPQLFGKPQTYAHFLGEELFYVYKGQLLIVMPAGLGLNGPHRAAGKAALAGLTVPAEADSDAMARIAMTAVRRLAAADGHKLAAPTVGPATQPATSSSGGHSTSIAVILGAAAAAAVVVGGIGGVLVSRSRRR